jgi:hypothetical protein
VSAALDALDQRLGSARLTFQGEHAMVDHALDELGEELAAFVGSPSLTDRDVRYVGKLSGDDGVELEREVEGLRRRVAELVGERDRGEARPPLGGEPTLFEEGT